jgi:hypothetical protein
MLKICLVAIAFLLTDYSVQAQELFHSYEMAGRTNATGGPVWSTSQITLNDDKVFVIKDFIFARQKSKDKNDREKILVDEFSKTGKWSLQFDTLYLRFQNDTAGISARVDKYLVKGKRLRRLVVDPGKSIYRLRDVIFRKRD